MNQFLGGLNFCPYEYLGHKITPSSKNRNGGNTSTSAVRKAQQRSQSLPLETNNSPITERNAKIATATIHSSERKPKKYVLPDTYSKYLDFFIQLQVSGITPIKVKDFYEYVWSMRVTHRPSIRVPSRGEFAKNIQARRANFTANMEIPLKVLFRLSEVGCIQREDLVECLKKYGFEKTKKIKDGKLIPPIGEKGPTIEYKTKEQTSEGQEALYTEQGNKDAPLFKKVPLSLPTLSSTISFSLASESIPSLNVSELSDLGEFKRGLEETLENSQISKKRKLPPADDEEIQTHGPDLEVEDLLHQLSEKVQIEDTELVPDDKSGKLLQQINELQIADKEDNVSFLPPLPLTEKQPLEKENESPPIELPSVIEHSPQENKGIQFLNNEEIFNLNIDPKVILEQVLVPISADQEGSESQEEIATQGSGVQIQETEQPQELPPFPGPNPTRIIDSGMPFIVKMVPQRGEDGNLTYRMVDITPEILGENYDLVEVCNWWQFDRFLTGYTGSKRREIKDQIIKQIREILKMSKDERKAWYNKYMRIETADKLGGNRGNGVVSEDSKGIPPGTCFPYAGILWDEKFNSNPDYAWKVSRLPKEDYTLDGSLRSNIVSTINSYKLPGRPGTEVGKQNMCAIGIAGPDKNIMLIVYVSVEHIPPGKECLVFYGSEYQTDAISKGKIKNNSDINVENILPSFTRSNRKV